MSYPCPQYKNQTCCPCGYNDFPERDKPKGLSKGYENVTYSGEFPPPEPPMGNYGDWDLQFCKWWGWTWVRKGDGPPGRAGQNPLRKKRATVGGVDEIPDGVPPPSSPHGKSGKKKKKSIFCCLKRKAKKGKSRHEAQQMPSNTFSQQEQVTPRKRRSRSEDDSSSSEDCCCCCCNMPQETYYCCPCIQNMGQPNMGQHFSYNQGNADGGRRFSKTIETQTQRNVREQETKMSRCCINKDTAQNTSMHHMTKRHHKKKCCKRRCCCSCMRPMCCPCIYQPPNNNMNNTMNKNDNINNASNNNYSPTPNKNNIVNFFKASSNSAQAFNNKYDSTYNKSGDTSFLHKPLDLLLKNNMNIVKMFKNKEFAQPDDQLHSMDGNDTISFLSNRNESIQNNENEHCKLLTAICDAILSSHKFEHENNPIFENALKVANSKSTHVTRSTTISSVSLNIDKILNEKANYHYIKGKKHHKHSFSTTDKAKSEIGTQVGNNVEKVESFSQTQKFEATKITRIPAPLLKRKVSGTRTFSAESRKRPVINRELMSFSDDKNKKPITTDEDSKRDTQRNFELPETTSDTSPRLEDIERILNCINFDVRTSDNLDQCEQLFFERPLFSDFSPDKNSPSTSKK